MINIPSEASPEVQESFRQVNNALNRLNNGNIDLNGRRIINAGRSVGSFDYVTRYELTRDVNFPRETVRQVTRETQVINEQAEPGAGLLARLDGTRPFSGSRTVTGSWAFEPIGTVAPFTTSKTTVVTNLNSDQLDGNDAESGSGDIARLDGTGAFTSARNFTANGPFSFGGTGFGNVFFTLQSTFTPSAGSGQGMFIGPTINALANQNAFGLNVGPTLVEAASGTHTIFSSAIFQAPTITTAAAGLTVASTVYILDAPTEGSNNYALFIDSGIFRLDDGVAMGGGATPTLGTIGGSGPATAAQNQWLRANIGGTDVFIPVWT